MKVTPRQITLEELVAKISDSSTLAVPANFSGAPIAATLALIERGVKDLHLIAMPTSGLQVDLLVGAGAVTTVECAAISLGEFGLAPRFRASVEAGTLRVIDATCPAILSGFIAAAKGIPFLPMRGILGSDLLTCRDDWIVAQNPMTTDKDPIVLIPAIHPDTLLFHSPLCDIYGNVWVGQRRELITAANSARQTLVTAEKIVEENLLEDPARAPALLSHVFVDSVAQVKGGAWPLGLDVEYGPDAGTLRYYADQAQSEAGFAACLARLSEGKAP